MDNLYIYTLVGQMLKLVRKWLMVDRYIIIFSTDICMGASIYWTGLLDCRAVRLLEKLQSLVIVASQSQLLCD